MKRRWPLCLLAAIALVCAAPLPAEETTGFRFYDEQGALLNDVTVAFHTGTVSSKMPRSRTASTPCRSARAPR